MKVQDPPSGAPGRPSGKSPSFWKGKRILVVSPEPWGSQRVSKHHYAQAACDAGARVYFLGPRYSDSIRVAAQNGDTPTLVSAPRPLRGMRFLPERLCAQAEARYLQRIATACGGRFDLLWNFDLYRFRHLTERTGALYRLLHVMDLPRPSDLRRPAQLADGIILISDRMREHVQASDAHVMQLPHGLSTKRQDMSHPPELPPGTKMGYLGNLAIPYLDLAPLVQIAERYPQHWLYLMGPMGGDLGGNKPADAALWERLTTLPNVVLTGPIPFDRIDVWLRAMDLLLISYDTVKYPRETAHPHKVLEYLRSGRTILASHMMDMMHVRDHITMMEPSLPISAAIDQVLAELPKTNAADKQQARMEFARSMGYDQLLDRIARFIQGPTDG